MAGEEAATVKKGWGGRRASSPSCDLLCTCVSPVAEGNLWLDFVSFALVFSHKSAPDSLSCLWETGCIS